MSQLPFGGQAAWMSTTLLVPTPRGPALPHSGASISRQRLATDSVGSATLTLTGFPSGTDIVVLDAGTTDVVHQVDSIAGTTYAYVYGIFLPSKVVDIGFIKLGYEVFYIRNFTLPTEDSALPVALRPDRNFT